MPLPKTSPPVHPDNAAFRRRLAVEKEHLQRTQPHVAASERAVAAWQRAAEAEVTQLIELHAHATASELNAGGVSATVIRERLDDLDQRLLSRQWELAAHLPTAGRRTRLEQLNKHILRERGTRWQETVLTQYSDSRSGGDAPPLAYEHEIERTLGLAIRTAPDLGAKLAVSLTSQAESRTWDNPCKLEIGRFKAAYARKHDGHTSSLAVAKHMDDKVDGGRADLAPPVEWARRMGQAREKISWVQARKYKGRDRLLVAAVRKYINDIPLYRD